VKRTAAVLAVLAALLAGCGSGHRMLRPDDLSGVVLRKADLPGWTRFQSDPGTAADAGALGSRDRTGDWIARFRRAAAIVVSRVDIYRSSSAAHAAFANVTSSSGANGAQQLKVPPLGEERGPRRSRSSSGGVRTPSGQSSSRGAESRRRRWRGARTAGSTRRCAKAPADRRARSA
jgi:hypothetical protein